MSGGKPGRRGTVEGHARLAEITRDLDLGVPQAEIARSYGCSSDAIHRWAKAHPPAAGAAGDIGEPTSPGDATDPLAVLASLQARLGRLLTRAERARQNNVVVNVSREIRQVSETIARLRGNVDSTGALRQQRQTGDAEDVRERLRRKMAAVAGCRPEELAPIGAAGE